MKHLFILVSILLIFSCSSQHENDALKELSYLGGVFTISNGYNVSSKNENVKYKKISVTNLDLFEKDLVESQLLASKIAYVFYQHLDENERDFDMFEVELIKSTGIVYSYEISKNKLGIIEKEIKFVNDWILELKNNRIEESYDKYFNIGSPNIPPRETYISTIEKLEPKFGKVDSLMLNGFGIQNVDDSLIVGGEVNEFMYQFICKNGIYAIGIFVNPADKQFKIQGITLDAD